ncbi:MAG: hypothetical protein AAFY03_03350 [Pseudomonadota bacterium]
MQLVGFDAPVTAPTVYTAPVTQSDPVSASSDAKPAETYEYPQRPPAPPLRSYAGIPTELTAEILKMRSGEEDGATAASGSKPADGDPERSAGVAGAPEETETVLQEETPVPAPQLEEEVIALRARDGARPPEVDLQS